MDKKLYRLEEFVTSGWQTIEKCSKMTKENATLKYDDLISLGHNPNLLRVQRDDN